MIRLLNNIIFSILFTLLFFYYFPFIIDWWYSDDIYQLNNLKDHGLTKSLVINYAYNTIGRISGIGWIDTILNFLNSIGLSAWKSLVIYKFFTIFALILSFVFFYKSFCINDYRSSYMITIFSMIIFCISTDMVNLYHFFGVDLSLYYSPLIYFLLMVSVSNMELKNKNKNFFILFLFIFILYINSAYSSLAIGGVYLVLKYIHIDEIKFLKNNFKLIIIQSFNYRNYLNIFSNKYYIYNVFNFNLMKLITCLFIYLFFAIFNLLSPSTFLRENIWPSNESLIDGFLSSFILIEKLIIYEWGINYLLITFFAFLFFYKNPYLKNKITNQSLIICILFAPLTVFFVNSLAYLSSYLHFPYLEQHTAYIFRNLENFSPAISPRHVVHLNLSAIITYTSLGIFFGKNFNLKNDKI